MANRRCLYDLLFKTAPQALLQLGLDSKRLGAQLGITTVLHTWTRDLSFHPHLHCVVTGGGLASNGQDWVSTRPGFLFPVRVLGALFRGKFLAALVRLHENGKLKVKGVCSAAEGSENFQAWLAGLRSKNWLVYCKPPFGSAAAVFAYLGRYTHRTGISDRRLLQVTDEQIVFRTRHGKSTSVTGLEFLRRLMLHVLPKGFVRIRHFGLLAASNVSTKLEVARARLEAPRANAAAQASTVCSDETRTTPSDYMALYYELTGVDLRCCPACGAAALTLRALPASQRAPP